MEHAYVLTGEVRADARSLVLDEPAPTAVACKKVRVTLQTVEPAAAATLAPRPKRPVLEVLDEIRARQKARGHVPPTKEEIDRYIEEERNSWE